jgi:hypothetical protein
MHVPTENKDDGIKYSFDEEIECECDQFHRYQMKIFLDFTAAIYILKSAIGNEGLHETSDGYRVACVNFGTSKS